jgi:hypothetical protein
MPDILQPVTSSSSGVVNGAAITLTYNTGAFARSPADITNLNTASGTINQRLMIRFDDVRFYSGDSAS